MQSSGYMGEKRLQFQTSSSTQSSQASAKHKAHTDFNWCRVHPHTLMHTYTQMGEQSPVTLKRTTLNYLNDQTESEKRGRESVDGAAKIPECA